MKKLIIIFGVFLIVCVIVTHFAQQQTAGKIQFEDTVGVNEEVVDGYTIKSENGRIVVYQGEQLLYKTDTATSTLPKIDQKELLYGIVVDSKQDVERVLENYCS